MVPRQHGGNFNLRPLQQPAGGDSITTATDSRGAVQHLSSADANCLEVDFSLSNFTATSFLPVAGGFKPGAFIKALN